MSSKIHNSKIPKVIHNYELEKEIFEIPCGKLFIGNNNYINQKVYIRIYDKYKLFTSFKEVSFINNEIFILKHLNHKNILQLYEYIESDYFIFLIFEYFKGDTLQNFFTKRKKINENLSVKIIYEIIRTMNYIHNLNICHLNLNFDNILIDEKYNIKIINFKYSCFYKEEENINKEIIQKNNIFSCPEIFAKQYYSPQKADVYSCGIMLYYFLMGNFPFHSDKKRVIEELIMKGKYTIPNNLQKNIKNIISKMLEYKKEQRASFKDIINCEWFKENKNLINKPMINKGTNILKQKNQNKQNNSEDILKKILDIYKLTNVPDISKEVKNINDGKVSIYRQITRLLETKNIIISKEDDKNENIEKYIKLEKEKDEKVKEIEDNFYLNGIKVFEELSQIKLKLEEQNLLINKNEIKNKYIKESNLKKDRDKDKDKTKGIKFTSLKTNKRNKQTENHKKVTLKSDHNGTMSKGQSSKNLTKSTKIAKEKNDNFLTLPSTGRKRIFTVRMKNPKTKENIINGIEKKDKDMDLFDNLPKKYKRGISFHHVKFNDKNNNKIKNNSANKSADNKINDNLDKIGEKKEENHMDKEDFEIPIRKRIYSTVNKKQKKIINFVGKKDKDKKLNNSLIKVREEKSDEDNLFKIQRKRIFSTVSKKNKKNSNYISRKYSIKDEKNIPKIEESIEINGKINNNINENNNIICENNNKLKENNNKVNEINIKRSEFDNIENNSKMNENHGKINENGCVVNENNSKINETNNNKINETVNSNIKEVNNNINENNSKKSEIIEINKNYENNSILSLNQIPILKVPEISVQKEKQEEEKVKKEKIDVINNQEENKEEKNKEEEVKEAKNEEKKNEEKEENNENELRLYSDKEDNFNIYSDKEENLDIYSDKEETNNKDKNNENINEKISNNNDNESNDSNIKKIIEFESDNNDTLDNKKEIQNNKIKGDFNLFSHNESKESSNITDNKDIKETKKEIIINEKEKINSNNNEKIQKNLNKKENDDLDSSVNNSSDIDKEKKIKEEKIKKEVNIIEEEKLKNKNKKYNIKEGKEVKNLSKKENDIKKERKQNIKNNNREKNENIKSNFQKEKKITKKNVVDTNKNLALKKENKKNETIKKDKFNEDYDYLKSKIVPKKTLINYEKSLEQLYESRNENKEPNKTNAYTFTKKNKNNNIKDSNNNDIDKNKSNINKNKDKIITKDNKNQVKFKDNKKEEQQKKEINKSVNKVNRIYNFNGFKNRNNSKNNTKIYLNKAKRKEYNSKNKTKKQNLSHSFCYTKIKIKK